MARFYRCVLLLFMRHLERFSCLLAFLFFAMSVSKVHAEPLRIMAVGDSITAGFTAPKWSVPFGFGARSELYSSLNEVGVSIQFVGTSGQPWNYSSGNFPVPPASLAEGVVDLREVDQDYHRGYGGKGIGFISKHIANWIELDDPDLILLMIGINSIGRGSAKAPTVQTAALEQLVENVFSAKPDVTLIVAQITPYSTYSDAIVQYNRYIREELVPAFQAAGRQISTVDQYANFLTDPDDLRSIDVSAFAAGSPNHPNKIGYDRMAQTWFEGMQQVLEPATSVQSIERSQSSDSVVNFRNFMGVNQGYGSADKLRDFVAWQREDLKWNQMEPKAGQWNQAALQTWGDRVLKLKSQGVTTLPILVYNTLWSIDRTPRVVDVDDDSRVELKQLENGDFIKEDYVKSPNGGWVLKTSDVIKPSVTWSLAEDHVQDWENYVRRVVTFLRAPPYNVEYFQIWNEAHPDSGFWKMASMDDYMTRVHLTAARIIHELGGKVVYGGWPSCGAISDYIAMLDRNDAWGSIDIHDIHYFNVDAFAEITEAARARGYGAVPLWQTEIGYTPKKSSIPNLLPRFLSWGLKQGWTNSDQYKLFWFPAWSPDDPKAFGYVTSLVLSERLSGHGLALQAVQSVFSPGGIELYEGEIQSLPDLDTSIYVREDSLEAFVINNERIVVAVHLNSGAGEARFADWNGAVDAAGTPVFSLRFPELSTEDVLAVRYVDMAGGRMALTALDFGAGVTLQVPMESCSGSPEWVNSSEMFTLFVELKIR